MKFSSSARSIRGEACVGCAANRDGAFGLRPLYCPWPHSIPTPWSAVFALHPWSVARYLGWCDHDYPRLGGHTPIPKCIATPSVLSAPASSIRSYSSTSRGSGPSFCPSHKGGALNLRSPFPSLLVSKHRPSVKKSSIWARKESPIWGMRSGPPRNYKSLNRQAGCPQRLSPSQERDPVFLLTAH
jgi:hypothetical protein